MTGVCKSDFMAVCRLYIIDGIGYIISIVEIFGALLYAMYMYVIINSVGMARNLTGMLG